MNFPTPRATTEIIFKCSKPDGAYGLHKITECTFKLGLGPCGRVVKKLTAEVTDILLTITQVSYATEEPDADGWWSNNHRHFMDVYRPRWWGICKGNLELYEHHREALNAIHKRHKEWRDGREDKRFIYKLSDIHGRIVVIK